MSPTSSVSVPSSGTDDEGRSGGPRRSIHSFSSHLSSAASSSSSSVAAASANSDDQYSDVLDPLNPPVLSLSHYHLLLSRLSERTAVKNTPSTQTNTESTASPAPPSTDSDNSLSSIEGESVEEPDDSLVKALFPEGGQGRTLFENLERLSDRQLQELLAAEQVKDEEIDPQSSPKRALSETDPVVSITNSPLFNELSNQLGVSNDHLKQLSAYALLMRRKLADSLGLIPSDVERISESGRLSQHLLRIVESELAPSHPRFTGLLGDEDIDVTSLGTLGSTATMARLSAVSEWQSAYHPRKLTSRSNRMKYCKICIGEANRDPRYHVTYTNVELLHSFINERGKIIGRRHTRVCAKHQRSLQKEIKRARNMALLGWLSDWKVPDQFVQEFYGDQAELQQMSVEIEKEKEEEQKEKRRYRRSIGIIESNQKDDTDKGLDKLFANTSPENFDVNSLSDEEAEKLVRGDRRDDRDMSQLSEDEIEDRFAERRRAHFTGEQKLMGRKREETIDESFVAEELEESLQRMDELYNDRQENRRGRRSIYGELAPEDKDFDEETDVGKRVAQFRKDNQLDPAAQQQQVNQTKRKKK